jgi:putative peptidoglycan lipid II flippase
MLPYLIGLSLASLMMGVCHAMSVFGAPALGSTALNLTMIAAGGLAIGLGVEPNRAVRWLGWAVLVGAAIRMALMVPAMARAGWRWRPSVSFRDREVGKLFRMLGTGLFGLSINQFNIFIAGFLAGFLAVGVKAFLVNASRLVQFPMALTATALATAMLPRLTDLIVKGREDELRDVVGFAKRVEMVLMLPAILGLAAFGLPIVKLINQHGAWTEIDSIGVHETLIFFAPALLPWGWSRLVMPIYYARKDVMTPVKAAALGMIVNVILGVAFTFFTDLAHRGLALASTVSAFVVYGALSWDLRRDPARPLEGGRIGETFVKCLAAAAAAVGAGRLAYEGLIRVVDPSASKWAEAATLLPTIALVALLYFPLAHLFRTPDSDKALEMLKRRIERS